ncbi:MAG TPA: glycosyl hydrolase family 28-related protein, partial [Fimbriimonadaceae bacterium]|nr:glycosyl hydrolase family 28-related protein [Fimbriimonadaceae bacterium]
MLPVIALLLPSTLDIRTFGAVGDGKTLCTQAIQRAIDAAAKAGPGVVEVPAGTFLSGSIHLRSGVEL